MQKIEKNRILKREILKKYQSVRNFASEMGIPYSTVASGLDRGIEGMAYETVARMCEVLKLNPIDFSPLDQGNSLSEKMLCDQVLPRFLALNESGREKVLELMDDYVQLSKYRKK